MVKNPGTEILSLQELSRVLILLNTYIDTHIHGRSAFHGDGEMPQHEDNNITTILLIS